MLKSHFHASGRNAPLSGFPVKVLQFVPFSRAQFGCSKKCQGYELQRKFGLPLTAVRLQFLQECWQLLEWHSSVTLRFPCRPQSVLEISGWILRSAIRQTRSQRSRSAALPSMFRIWQDCDQTASCVFRLAAILPKSRVAPSCHRSPSSPRGHLFEGISWRLI